MQTADDADWYLARLRNYGSLFLGDARDRRLLRQGRSGTNHVLPTGGAARYTGGLSVGKFLKTLTYQRLTAEGTRAVAPAIAAICDAEQMHGHALTARHAPGPPRGLSGRRRLSVDERLLDELAQLACAAGRCSTAAAGSGTPR